MKASPHKVKLFLRLLNVKSFGLSKSFPYLCALLVILMNHYSFSAAKPIEIFEKYISDEKIILNPTSLFDASLFVGIPRFLQ